jgi:hypothetical protein
MTFGELSGITSDISRSGMLIQFKNSGPSKAGPHVGDPARIVLDLPRGQNFPARCLDCVATVVRVTAPAIGPRLLAFQFRRIRIRNSSQAPSALTASAPEFAGCSYIH